MLFFSTVSNCNTTDPPRAGSDVKRTRAPAQTTDDADSVGAGCDQRYIPVDVVERAVERTYAELAPSAEQIDAVRAKLDHALAERRTQPEQKTARQRRRLARLTDQRAKLLHAYYENAIPLDVLHQEQDRLAGQITNAEAQLSITQQSLTTEQRTLEKALELLANCHDSYTKAPGHLRRQWNQALFKRLLVSDQNIHDTESVMS